VAKGAKKQKVVAEEYAAMAPDQWPVRPYLEKFVAPLLMEAMQVGRCMSSSSVCRTRLVTRQRRFVD